MNTFFLRMNKPTKTIYNNQEEIHDKIVDFVKSKLTNDVKEAYLFGSSVTKDFGKYTEKYGEHEGSDIDIMIIIPNNKIPKEWKYLNTEKKWWKLYKIGKINLNGINHRLDTIIVKDGKEDYAKKRIKELGWDVERLK